MCFVASLIEREEEKLGSFELLFTYAGGEMYN